MDEEHLFTLSQTIRWEAVAVYDAARANDWTAYAEALKNLETAVQRAQHIMSR